MDKKYFNVTYFLSNGEKRNVFDVVAENAEEAMLNAPEIATQQYVYLKTKVSYHKIHVGHIVEVAAKEVPSPEQRKKNSEKNLAAIESMRF